MDWFLNDSGLHHERVKAVSGVSSSFVADFIDCSEAGTSVGHWEVSKEALCGAKDRAYG